MDSHTINIVSVLLMLLAFASSDNAKDREECAESLIGLSTCLPYVGGTATAPTPDCCSGLKQVLNTKKKCLCVIIKDRNDPDLGLSINATLALGLPQVCNAPANISQCPVLLNMPPNSPDAQIFYQAGQESSNTSSSPVAGETYANVKPNPTIVDTPGSSGEQESDGSCGNGKRYLFGVLVFLWCFTANLII